MGPISHALWADNVYFLAVQREHLLQMGADFEVALLQHGHSFKQGSVKYVTSQPGKENGRLSLPNGTKVETVQQLDELGEILQWDGRCDIAVDERLAATTRSFYKFKSALTNRRIDSKQRFELFRERMQGVALLGSGGWTVTKGLIAKLYALENCILRRVWNAPLRSGESPGAWILRSTRVAREVLRQCGVKPLVHCVLEAVFRHARRAAMPEPDGASHLVKAAVNILTSESWGLLQAAA